MTDQWSRNKPHAFRHQGEWVLASWHRRDDRTGMRVWLAEASAPTIRDLTRKVAPPRGFWSTLGDFIEAIFASPPLISAGNTAWHMRPATAGLLTGQADGPLSNVPTRST